MLPILPQRFIPVANPRRGDEDLSPTPGYPQAARTVANPRRGDEDVQPALRDRGARYQLRTLAGAMRTLTRRAVAGWQAELRTLAGAMRTCRALSTPPRWATSCEPSQGDEDLTFRTVACAQRRLRTLAGAMRTGVLCHHTAGGGSQLRTLAGAMRTGDSDRAGLRARRVANPRRADEDIDGLHRHRGTWRHVANPRRGDEDSVDAVVASGAMHVANPRRGDEDWASLMRDVRVVIMLRTLTGPMKTGITDHRAVQVSSLLRTLGSMRTSLTHNIT